MRLVLREAIVLRWGEAGLVAVSLSLTAADVSDLEVRAWLWPDLLEGHGGRDRDADRPRVDRYLTET